MAKPENKRAIYVYAHWKGLDNPELMGHLYSERVRGDEIFSFEYDTEWLRKGTFQLLDPNLQLYPGLHFIDEDQHNFGM